MSPSHDRYAELHIAVYSESGPADTDFERMKDLATRGAIAVGGLALVKRDDGGKIHLTRRAHSTRRATMIGTVSGAVVGLIFPPAVIPAGAVGAGIGGSIGKLVSRRKRHKVTAAVDYALPPGRTAILALLSEADVEDAFPAADFVVAHDVAGDSPTPGGAVIR